MGCFDDVLRPGEKIVRRVRLRWVIFLQPSLWLLVALSFHLGLAATVLGWLPAGQASVGEQISFFWQAYGLDPFLVAALFALAVGVLGFVFAAARFRSTELVVTSERVLGRSGLLSPVEFGVTLEEASEARVQQGIAGALRLCGRLLSPLPLLREFGRGAAVGAP